MRGAPEAPSGLPCREAVHDRLLGDAVPGALERRRVLLVMDDLLPGRRCRQVLAELVHRDARRLAPPVVCRIGLLFSAASTDWVDSCRGAPPLTGRGPGEQEVPSAPHAPQPDYAGSLPAGTHEQTGAESRGSHRNPQWDRRDADAGPCPGKEFPPPGTTKGSRVAPEALVITSKTGAGNRIRTGDPQLGNLTVRRRTLERTSRLPGDYTSVISQA